MLVAPAPAVYVGALATLFVEVEVSVVVAFLSHSVSRPTIPQLSTKPMVMESAATMMRVSSDSHSVLLSLVELQLEPPPELVVVVLPIRSVLVRVAFVPCHLVPSLAVSSFVVDNHKLPQVEDIHMRVAVVEDIRDDDGVACRMEDIQADNRVASDVLLQAVEASNPLEAFRDVGDDVLEGVQNCSAAHSEDVVVVEDDEVVAVAAAVVADVGVVGVEVRFEVEEEWVAEHLIQMQEPIHLFWDLHLHALLQLPKQRICQHLHPENIKLGLL
ncbi:hypothetical protein GCK72_002560 [Caenorhabditis remanei]|uniref:Uncharacterized protein n=1 Tax=Caenorhabditis remanei TaxID=31234 RepID=A0A6A5HWK5_CAERE|nr:hypothetical protein GCK72_002560 [Caenorhabditis remanei]KAF1770737.1 hypothetical protein GCK72_002560 [Caenorhabditis remanei]